MDRLPAEILSEIVSQLRQLREGRYDVYGPKLAPYAAINREWQAAIERVTFRHIKTNTNTLTKLISMLSSAAGDQRIRSIRTLEFTYHLDVLLDIPSLDPTERSELLEQHRLQSEAFSENMRMLFAMLKGWEERLGGSEGVAEHELCLNLGTMPPRGTHPFVDDPWVKAAKANPPLPPSSRGEIFIPPRLADAAPDDPPYIPPVETFTRPLARPWPEYLPKELVGRPPDVYVRYIGEKLPELSIVSSVVFSVMFLPDPYIHPESVMQILSGIKRLDYFSGHLFEESRGLSHTREYRKVLAQSLHLLPKSLRIFAPEFRNTPREPQTWYSLLVDPRRDDLCISIRTFSGQLQNLHLHGLRISPAIFAGDGSGSYPDWSCLEYVTITYPVISSTGQWFANIGPPEEVDEEDFEPFGYDPNYDELIFYSIPEPKLLNEFYVAAGKARQHMPSLKRMRLSLSISRAQHRFLYGFDRERNSITIAIWSRIAFEFTNEVAEAWGFSLDKVNSFVRDGTNITEVIVT